MFKRKRSLNIEKKTKRSCHCISFDAWYIFHQDFAATVGGYLEVGKMLNWRWFPIWRWKKKHHRAVGATRYLNMQCWKNDAGRTLKCFPSSGEFVSITQYDSICFGFPQNNKMQKFRVDAPKKGASFFCFTMKFCIFVEMPILHVHKKESISLGEKKNRFIEKQNDDFWKENWYWWILPGKPEKNVHHMRNNLWIILFWFWCSRDLLALKFFVAFLCHKVGYTKNSFKKSDKKLNQQKKYLLKWTYLNINLLK